MLHIDFPHFVKMFIQYEFCILYSPVDRVLHTPTQTIIHLIVNGRSLINDMHVHACNSKLILFLRLHGSK